MSIARLSSPGLIFILLTVSLVLTCSRKSGVSILPPDELYGELFHDVQNDSAVFADSKTFVDCVPRIDPFVIRMKYAEHGPMEGAALATFVRDNFILPAQPSGYTADSASICSHIATLWNVLRRPADVPHSGTLIPLPHPYIVPGGRFREIYYWDSYFTMLGLAADGKTGLMRNMLDNFAHLIDKYGFIPNGNRTYYLSRSQPPFFSMMVALLAEHTDSTTIARYIPAIEKEYAFWMDGSDRPCDTCRTYRRVVFLDEGSILNRYWDDRNDPRSESYREDRRTAAAALDADTTRTEKEIYRNLRAAAESGWDFSSRWLDRDSSGAFQLYTIHTTRIIPVDLNCLLYTTESMLYSWYQSKGDSAKTRRFRKASRNRKEAIIRFCWNPDSAFFFDYNFVEHKQTGIIAASGIYPLFTGIADSAQARAVGRTIRSHLLFTGGIAATVNETGQQWDKPNGWPPLQWVTVSGLRRYGLDSFADTIATRWCSLNRKVYSNTFKLSEKYNVVDMTKPGGGGEYPTQDGFGWTNGVYRKMCGCGK